MSRKIALPLAGRLIAVLAAAPSFALTDRWAAWSPIEGTSNAFRLTMTQRSPGFPVATVASDSRSPVQLPSGASAFLGAGTPPGAKYGSSAGNPYLVLRPRADTPTRRPRRRTRSTHPTPDTGWAFVLGDIDADQVAGPRHRRDRCRRPRGRDRLVVPRDVQLRRGADQPTWDAATSTLTGNPGAVDTDGATGWFEPDVRLTSLTMIFTRRSGFPVYQTWFVSRARPIGGSVDDVSAVGTCPVGGTTLTPGVAVRREARHDHSGRRRDLLLRRVRHPGRVRRARWTSRRPASCSGRREQTVSNRGNDDDPASRADFDVRAIVPQPISGTVRDDDGAPVAGVDCDPHRPRRDPRPPPPAADGTYLFDDNPIGTGYTVTIAVPAGYIAGPGGAPDRRHRRRERPRDRAGLHRGGPACRLRSGHRLPAPVSAASR